MNSLAAKQKYCPHISKLCLADGCMLWKIKKHHPPIESTRVDVSLIDHWSNENKEVVMLVIRDGILRQENYSARDNLFHNPVAIKSIPWSEYIDVKVQNRDPAHRYSASRKQIFYAHDQKLWMEKIATIQ